jgi:hypothetical protein
MSASTRAIPARLAMLALAPLLLASASSAPPAVSAGTTQFRAAFDERTTFVACPPDTPPGSRLCFSGRGTGTANPPGGRATETYRGVVALAAADPNSGCVPDFNAVAIGTRSGTLFVLTQGKQCPGVPGDQGTWAVVTGTGSFAGATGGGSVATTDVVQNRDGTVSSRSTYSGTLTIPSDRDDREDRER